MRQCRIRRRRYLPCRLVYRHRINHNRPRHNRAHRQCHRVQVAHADVHIRIRRIKQILRRRRLRRYPAANARRYHNRRHPVRYQPAVKIADTQPPRCQTQQRMRINRVRAVGNIRRRRKPKPLAITAAKILIAHAPNPNLARGTRLVKRPPRQTPESRPRPQSPVCKSRILMRAANNAVRHAVQIAVRSQVRARHHKTPKRRRNQRLARRRLGAPGAQIIPQINHRRPRQKDIPRNIAVFLPNRRRRHQRVRHQRPLRLAQLGYGRPRRPRLQIVALLKQERNPPKPNPQHEKYQKQQMHKPPPPPRLPRGHQPTLTENHHHTITKYKKQCQSSQTPKKLTNYSPFPPGRVGVGNSKTG